MTRTRLLLRLLAGTLAATALAAPAAQAASYRMAKVSPDRVVLIDPIAIWSSPDHTQREAYVISVQRSIMVGDPPVPGYVRTLQQFDCSAATVNWREFQAFSRSGALLVKRTNTDAPPAPANRDFETLATYRMVCEDSPGDSVLQADSIAKAVIALMARWDTPPPAPLLPIPALPGVPPARR